MRILLIQPRSPWGLHPYLPNGLLAVAARLRHAGNAYALVDENLGTRLDDLRRDVFAADAIGIGCLGSPYVTETRRVAAQLRGMGYTGLLLIGGEFVKRLDAVAFGRLFGSYGPVTPCGDEEGLEIALGVNAPSIFDLSMGPVIDELPSSMRRAYFGKEWCLFTSQGCVYRCHFCAASKGMIERFRDPGALEDEVASMARAVCDAAGPAPGYEVYCSTLDGFQTPDAMERTLEIVSRTTRANGVRLALRFLATARCTVTAEQKFPGIIRRFREHGLACVGIGVDGMDAATWRRENKRHNDVSVVARSLDLLSENGIQPEAFMVIGLPGDDWRAIVRGGLACIRFARHGIRPRPYLGKSGVPGSKAWEDAEPIVETLLARPRLFRELDYGGLGSPVTHPDARQRRMANAMFLATCLALKATAVGCPTQPLLPSESARLPVRLLAQVWNRFTPQDR